MGMEYAKEETLPQSAVTGSRFGKSGEERSSPGRGGTVGNPSRYPGVKEPSKGVQRWEGMVMTPRRAGG